MPTSCSGSSRATARSSRSTTSTSRARSAATLRSGRFTVTRDRDFAAVIAACADREETWINAELEQAMLALHGSGHAHSIEVWHDGELVGGLYGVKLGRAFFGESMFSRDDRRIEGRARLAGRAPQGRQFHACSTASS